MSWDRGIFVCPGGFGSLGCVTLWFRVGVLGMPENLTKWQKVGALGHAVSACLPDWLETEVSHMVSLSFLHDGVSIKTLDTKSQVSVPTWQYSLCIVTHQCWECNTVLVSKEGEDTWKLCICSFPTCISVSFPFADFHVYPFTIVNHNWEENSFLWDLWVLL